MILDTSAVSALLAGESGLALLLEPEERHHLPTIVVGEYRYGLRRSHSRAVLTPMLETLIRNSVVLDVTLATAESYAEVRDELRGIGKPIPENDVWIAALARQHDLPVVSRDAHFDCVPGLVRLHW